MAGKKSDEFGSILPEGGMTSEWAIHRDNLVVVAASPPHSPRGGAGVAEEAGGSEQKVE